MQKYTDTRNSVDIKGIRSTFHDDGVYHSGGGGVFNKEKIMKTLQELYRFKVDRDTIALFKQYVADYLGINIFIEIL